MSKQLRLPRVIERPLSQLEWDRVARWLRQHPEDYSMEGYQFQLGAVVNKKAGPLLSRQLVQAALAATSHKVIANSETGP